MKFFAIARFRGGLEAVPGWLVDELGEGLRKLLVGLRNLSFVDNFNGFRWEGTIAAATTVTITNPLGQIPSERVILRVRPLASGTIAIDDSQTEWTSSAVYLRNQGTAACSVVAFFIR